MADRKKKPSKRSEQAPLATSPAASLAASGHHAGDVLGDHEALFHAVEGFIRANANFESSIPINSAIDDIAQCGDLKGVFSLPLQRQLFTLDAALRWVLFLSVAPDHAVAVEGDESFSQAVPFFANEALQLITGVYDIGVQETVWDHFDPDDESDASGADDESE